MSARTGLFLLAVAACGDNRLVLESCLFTRCIGEGCLSGTLMTPGEPRQMVAGTTRLFLSDVEGILYELPIAGGELAVVVESGFFISALRAVDDRFAWAHNFGADFYDPAADPTVRTLTSDGITFGFAMDADAIYYGMQNNVLVRVTLADGEARPWAATQASALGVTISGADLYFTNCESVFRARNEVLGEQEAISRGGCSVEIVSNANTVAWTTRQGEAFSTVRRYDIATETVIDLVETVANERVVHVDDAYVYYAGGGALCRIPVDGGVAAKVAVGGSFAFDATDIYWTFNREIVRAPKPE